MTKILKYFFVPKWYNPLFLLCCVLITYLSAINGYLDGIEESAEDIKDIHRGYKHHYFDWKKGEWKNKYPKGTIHEK